MRRLNTLTRATSIVLGLAAATTTGARIIHNPNAAGFVMLPYTSGDGHGQTWMVFQPSSIQMQGNFPIYQQAGVVSVNGINPSLAQNQARIDDKTGELLLENMSVGPLMMTRRIKFNSDEGWIRVIDVIKNSTAGEQQVNLQLSSSVNYGVQSAQLVTNPKKPAQNLGWIAQVAGGQQKFACDVYSGPGAKSFPSVDYQQGNNTVQAGFSTPVPAGKEIALVHFHMVAQSQDQGTTWISSMKESKMFGDLPKEVRRAIVNFRAGGASLDNLDVLRGDALDVVELKSGDKFNGTLTDAAFKVDSAFGPVDLPADKVVGMVNNGQFHPRQLLVTTDGQVIGGQLEKQSVDLQLSTGQKVSIPMAQVSRLGYRRRAAEPEDGADDAAATTPYVLTDNGDRVAVTLPTAPIPVATRYGNLEIPAASIGSISFNSDDSGVHTITLTDGSHFAGLVTAAELEMKLGTLLPEKTVKFSISGLNKLVLKAPADDKADVAAMLVLKRDDALVCTLTGTLKLDTAFDTISLSADEVKSVVRSKENPADVNVTTWDGTVFSGQLQDQPLACHTSSGVDLAIATNLVESYTNPVTKIPAMMIERIKTVAKQLNADGWKDRDAAQAQLVKMGPGIVPTLQGLRSDAPPEAQQRIDTIIKQLQKP